MSFAASHIRRTTDLYIIGFSRKTPTLAIDLIGNFSQGCKQAARRRSLLPHL